MTKRDWWIGVGVVVLSVVLVGALMAVWPRYEWHAMNRGHYVRFDRWTGHAQVYSYGPATTIRVDSRVPVWPYLLGLVIGAGSLAGAWLWIHRKAPPSPTASQAPKAPLTVTPRELEAYMHYAGITREAAEAEARKWGMQIVDRR